MLPAHTSSLQSQLVRLRPDPDPFRIRPAAPASGTVGQDEIVNDRDDATVLVEVTYNMADGSRRFAGQGDGVLAVRAHG